MDRPNNQLDEDNRQWVAKYAFSLANGNHILRYSEEEYTNYLVENPESISVIFMLLFTTESWGINDERYFENYDEQWLAAKIDANFVCNVEIDLKDYQYKNLKPWQKAVIDFTNKMLETFKDISSMMISGTPIEMVYAVFMNNLDISIDSGEVINKEYAIDRGIEMFRNLNKQEYKPLVPFEKWETELF